MRAARWYSARDVRIESVPRPCPEPDQVLIEVELTGLCGTDLEEYLHGPVDISVTPVTLGHEIVGRVADCPSGIWPTGTRVIPDVVIGCGRCRACARHQPGRCERLTVLGLDADGGLAEYVLAPAGSCVAVPDELPAERAVFAEPLAVAIRAVRKAGDIAGSVCAVVGTGTVGCLVVGLLRATAAGTVIGIDTRAQRRALGNAFGADEVRGPAEVRDLLGQAAVVFECAGADAAVRTAVDVAAPGGRIVLVGTGAETQALPVRDLVLREKHLVGSAAHVWDEDVAGAVAVLRRGIIDPVTLITDVVPLERIVHDGFERLARDDQVIKVLVDPSGSAGTPRR
jgi:threonine dehydrogenase-like Zn-dependent dehydrogenase